MKNTLAYYLNLVWSLVREAYTKLEVTDSEKHSSLLPNLGVESREEGLD